ncbi:MAG TPA: hypothetical protein PJ994_05320, partial [Tepidiformaceae bacterium]|mgnify:CR=1|nr:hypothetical protein [Tepidiformaceae bacterium]
MPGPVESAIRRYIREGETLESVSQRKPFVVGEFRSDAMVLLLGESRSRTVLRWEALEAVQGFLRGKGRVELGSRHSADVDNDSFDGFMRRYIYRSVGSYVPAVLERAGIVDIDRKKAAAVKLRD